MQTFDTTTIEGRHELYKAMLTEIDAVEKQYLHGQSSCTYGLCFLLFTIMKFKIDLRNLPELWYSKPKRASQFGLYWFKPGEWKKRRAILVQCIEETHRAFTISTDNNDTPVT